MSDYRLDIEVSQDNALKNLDALARKLNEINSVGNSTAKLFNVPVPLALLHLEV